ncbi:regulator [Salmonella enterica subsp. enterica serovar Weybridge]|uniref:Regulator n=1 Tax=Salmonella typhimurium (strain SL1344) TaxID=216597 RepID=A0A718Y3W1_SALTS|nr:regulator [Salmonella enterica subsp. enterica serovar Weybridge]HAD6864590.1 regulator [Salmonella enterica subsp. enterica serovar Typhimurium str. SL1344]
MKESYIKIMSFLLKNKENKLAPAQTREIADAAGLSIYQARQHLEYLCAAGLVRKISSGRGRSACWRLIC